MTWAASGLDRSAPWFATPHVAWVVCRSAGALDTTPDESRLSCQQLPGVCRPLTSPRSPLVALPNAPLPANRLCAISLPQSSNRHNPGDCVPPSQCAIGGGVSVSGYGTSSTPHAPLRSMRLPLIVSKRPPATTIPVPTGPSSAVPAPGTFGLLLSWIQLSRKNVHERVPLDPGHEPSCGGGASSLFWLFVEMPVLLWSHSESSS